MPSKPSSAAQNGGMKDPFQYIFENEIYSCKKEKNEIFSISASDHFDGQNLTVWSVLMAQLTEWFHQ